MKGIIVGLVLLLAFDLAMYRGLHLSHLWLAVRAFFHAIGVWVYY